MHVTSVQFRVMYTGLLCPTVTVNCSARLLCVCVCLCEFNCTSRQVTLKERQSLISKDNRAKCKKGRSSSVRQTWDGSDIPLKIHTINLSNIRVVKTEHSYERCAVYDIMDLNISHHTHTRFCPEWFLFSFCLVYLKERGQGKLEGTPGRLSSR